MTNDRTYLRMMQDCELRVYATDNITTDLELVLLERLRELQDVEEQLEAMTNERDELDARCDIWKQQAIEAMDELDAKENDQ